MSVKEIIFLIQTPPTRRDYERFGLERLKNRGINAGFVDMTDVLNPEYREKVSIKKMDNEHVVQIDSVKGFEDFFASRDPGKLLIIDLIGARENSFFIYSIFRRFGIRYASFCANSIPLFSGISRSFMNAGFWKKVLKYAAKKFMRRSLFLMPPSYVLAGGKEFIEKLPSPMRTTQIIWAHTLDYDIYLEYRSRGSDQFINGDYAVFLDENWAYHPDFHVTGSAENVFKNDPKEYFDELKEMLDEVENKTGIRTVIAAHPRSQYKKEDDHFGGKREIHKMKTVDLVAGAKYVLAHGSTSINYAVLFNKPVIFLMPKKVKGGYYGKMISNYAKKLGKVPWEASSIKKMDPEVELTVDNDHYTDYKENYIKRVGTPEKYFWDIVVDEVMT